MLVNWKSLFRNPFHTASLEQEDEIERSTSLADAEDASPDEGLALDGPPRKWAANGLAASRLNLSFPKRTLFDFTHLILPYEVGVRVDTRLRWRIKQALRHVIFEEDLADQCIISFAELLVLCGFSGDIRDQNRILDPKEAVETAERYYKRLLAWKRAGEAQSSETDRINLSKDVYASENKILDLLLSLRKLYIEVARTGGVPPGEAEGQPAGEAGLSAGEAPAPEGQAAPLAATPAVEGNGHGQKLSVPPAGGPPAGGPPAGGNGQESPSKPGNQPDYQNSQEDPQNSQEDPLAAQFNQAAPFNQEGSNQEGGAPSAEASSPEAAPVVETAAAAGGTKVAGEAHARANEEEETAPEAEAPASIDSIEGGSQASVSGDGQGPAVVSSDGNGPAEAAAPGGNGRGYAAASSEETSGEETSSEASAQPEETASPASNGQEQAAAVEAVPVEGKGLETGPSTPPPQAVHSPAASPSAPTNGSTNGSHDGQEAEAGGQEAGAGEGLAEPVDVFDMGCAVGRLYRYRQEKFQELKARNAFEDAFIAFKEREPVKVKPRRAPRAKTADGGGSGNLDTLLQLVQVLGGVHAAAPAPQAAGEQAPAPEVKKPRRPLRLDGDFSIRDKERLIQLIYTCEGSGVKFDRDYETLEAMVYKKPQQVAMLLAEKLDDPVFYAP